ncbi:MAG: T9SS type A sorting domain-containing protein, partial [Bacteroidota bacterium]
LVQGIGQDKAAEIAFVNMTTFLGSAAEYPDAREGAIAAAELIFGKCSDEVRETTNAWSACGVGDPYQPSCLSLDGPRLICTDLYNNDMTYTAYGPPGASFIWQVPAQWQTVFSGQCNSSMTILSLGNYPPSLPYTQTISVTTNAGYSESMDILFDECRKDPGCDDGPFFGGGQGGNNKTFSDGSHDQLSIYPNPAKDELRIDLPEGSASLEIINMQGQVVHRLANPLKQNKIDIQALPTGVYKVRVKGGSSLQVGSFLKL